MSGADPLRDWSVGRGMWIGRAVAAEAVPAMGGGMGVVALEDVPRGARIASVPPQLMLTPRVARAECGLPASVPPITAIVVFLVTERVAYTETGIETPWSPWVSRLPSRYDNFIELHDAIGPGDAVSATDGADRANSVAPLIRSLALTQTYGAKIIREIEAFQRLADDILQHADTLFARLLSLLTSNNASATVSEVVDRRVLRWAYNSLMSRGFSYSDETWAMIPWVDYFNFSNTPNTTQSEGVNGSYDFITREDVARGSQLVISYGTYSDFELGLWYGFGLCRCMEGKWTHQEHCSYAFSPLSDANGVVPNGVEWAVDLLRWAGIAEVPQHWKPVKSYDLGRCRMFRDGCSDDMQTLILDAAEANRVSPIAVIRALLRLHLPPAEVALPVSIPSLPCLRLLLSIAKDVSALIHHVLGLSDAELSQWLNHTSNDH